MMNLKFLQLLINSLTLFLAYIMIISPVGWFRAWVADKVGDSTGRDLGFLTLNPLVHIDMVGIVVLFIFGVGWGKHIPINHLNIHQPRRGFKIAAAYFSDTVAHLVLATLALMSLIFLFGAHSYGMYMSSASSLGLSVARIIIALIHLNVFLAAIGLVINAVMVVALYIAERNVQFPSYFFYFIVLAPIFMLIIFGEDIRHFMMCGISWLGQFFAYVCGVK